MDDASAVEQVNSAAMASEASSEEGDRKPNGVGSGLLERSASAAAYDASSGSEDRKSDGLGGGVLERRAGTSSQDNASSDGDDSYLDEDIDDVDEDDVDDEVRGLSDEADIAIAVTRFAASRQFWEAEDLADSFVVSLENRIENGAQLERLYEQVLRVAKAYAKCRG